MEYLSSFRDGLTLSHEMTEEEFKAKKFGLPKLKKYPMPDAAHVRSAIKFFNYVDSKHEEELANAILARMDEYGMSFDDFGVGDENRFKRYMHKNELKHHGILGQKWGIRRFQNPDGSLTDEGRKRYGISDNSDDSFTVDKGSRLYRMANEGENLKEGKPKYYSILEEDRNFYREELIIGLFHDHTKPFGEYENSTKGKLTIKKGEKVISDLINKYGNEKQEELNKAYENVLDIRNRFKTREEISEYRNGYSGFDEDDYDQMIKQVYDSIDYDKIDDFVWDVMEKHGDEVAKDYKKQGYDAIVDPYDYIQNIADLPIIVLDPDKSVKQDRFRETDKRGIYKDMK